MSAEDLARRRRQALTALREMLTNARRDRPEMLDEITAIEEALENIEDVNDHVARFRRLLDVILANFIADAESRPPNIPNTDRLNRLSCIRNALNEYRNAYANYAAELIAQTRRRNGD